MIFHILSPTKYFQAFTQTGIFQKLLHHGGSWSNPAKEQDGFSMKTKPLFTHFGGNFGTLRLDEKSVFNTLLGFTPYWDSKPTTAIYADSTGVHISEKFQNSRTLNEIRLVCDVIDGSEANGLSKPTLFSFLLYERPIYKAFSEGETAHYERINKSVWNSITLNLEDEYHKENIFNGETLTFTLQSIKNYKVATS